MLKILGYWLAHLINAARYIQKQSLKAIATK
jgi:hypothetical protein